MSPSPISTPSLAGNALLLCGILSGLLYFLSDIVMSLMYKGYSFLHQTVSELNAIGAPTRNVSLVFGLAGYVLLFCFAVGIWRVAVANPRLRVVAAALAVLAITGLWGVPFASMQMRGAQQEWLHLGSGIAGLVFLLVAIGFAAAVFDTPFRVYSIATIVVMLLFAGWAGMQSARIEAGLSTPWVGVIERISFYSWHLWFIMLALLLFRRPAQ
jgi:hypothetical protein